MESLAGDARGRLDSTGREESLQTHIARKGIAAECVQTDNGFEFTNRFSARRRDPGTLFEATAGQLGIRRRLIRPYTPRRNGKVERSHREDQKRFYDSHRFYSLASFGGQKASHQSLSNFLPMRPLLWTAPGDVLFLPSLSNLFDKPTKMIFCLKVVALQCILRRKEKASGTIIWYCSIVYRSVTTMASVLIAFETL